MEVIVLSAARLFGLFEAYLMLWRPYVVVWMTSELCDAATHGSRFSKNWVRQAKIDVASRDSSVSDAAIQRLQS